MLRGQLRSARGVLTALAVGFAAPAIAQPLAPLDPRGDLDRETGSIQSLELYSDGEETDLRLQMPTLAMATHLSLDPRLLLANMRLTAQSDLFFATASVWGSYAALRVPKVLCLQPTIGGGTPPSLQLGMYYVCHGLHLGSGVYVSSDRRDPQRLDVTTSSVARYVTRRMDFGLGHHTSSLTSWLGKRPPGTTLQTLTATAGVRTTPTGPSLRALTMIPLAKGEPWSRVGASGTF